MLIPDYIAISVLVVLALWAGVERFLSPIVLATVRRSEAALIALGQSGGRTMRAVFRHASIYLPLPQYARDC
jgi:cytochrome c biogenesis protein CcdA